VTILRAEERIVNERLGITGTPDRVVEWPGVGYAVIDIKSGSLSDWTAIQLAAYKLLLTDAVKDDDWPRVLKRFAVNLPGDGTYKVKEYKDRADEGIFLAALSIHNWKKNHGGRG
jgi:expansin (peptidoglycan-binding protein)